MEPFKTVVGAIIAEVRPTEFYFLANPKSDLRVYDFITVKHPTIKDKPVLGKVVDLMRFNEFYPREAVSELVKKNIEIFKTVLPEEEGEYLIGTCMVLGFENEEGNFEPPSSPYLSASPVYLPDDEFLSKILTSKKLEKELEYPVYLGNLKTRKNVKVFLDGSKLVNRHICIFSITGAGKTYCASVVLEEILNHGYPVLIIDPHGDYVNLDKPSKPENSKKIKYKVSVYGTGYTDLKIDKSRVDPWELGDAVDLTDAQREAFKKLCDEVGVIDIDRILELIEEDKEIKRKNDRVSEATFSTLVALERKLRILKKMNIVGDTEPSTKDLIKPGQASILYLTGLPIETQQFIVYYFISKLFEERKLGEIPPFFLVVEEAHNYIPHMERVYTERPPLSRDILRKIATEGRKFGVGLCVISQRPSRVDPVVTSQCNSQIVLKIVNPTDQDYVRKTVEGLGEEEIRLLPGLTPGEAIVSGIATRFPVLIKVRERYSQEGIGERDLFAEVKEFQKKITEEEKRRVELTQSIILAEKEKRIK
jgi:DNA helicase HerA-like ATPase